MPKIFSKKLLSICTLISVCLFCFSIAAYSADEKQISVILNNNTLSFDVQPFIEDGRTMVPLRTISEELKYTVTWNDTERKVDIINNTDKLEIFIDNQQYFFNGVSQTMDVPAKIKDGRTMVPLRLIAESFNCNVDWIESSSTVVIDKFNVIEVSTAQELLENIDSYTRIILKDAEYNLSQVQCVDNKNIFIENGFDGNEVYINKVENLIIEANKNSASSIVVEPRYANVLNFMDCKNVTLKNLTVGHTIEQGYCTGGVINLESSINTTINGCKLYGCGTYGVTAESSTGIEVHDTEIYDCTYGCTMISNCNKVLFSNCIFRDCVEFSMFEFIHCDDILVENSLIKNNSSSEYFSLIHTDNTRAEFSNCEFTGNIFESLCNNYNNVYFNSCTLQNN